jgi:hypothetical protein
MADMWYNGCSIIITSVLQEIPLLDTQTPEEGHHFGITVYPWENVI